MKVLVPVLSKSEDAEISQEFGRAPFFAVIEDGRVSFYDNPGASASGGAGVKASQFVLSLGVDKVVLKKPAGPNAGSALEQAGVTVEVNENLKTLKNLL
ncbi:Predicted Fe-Mo cluster-binding protein, NifX family [Desulfurobacterium pacificum]|uniref:Predicted Fe-Mo cluster-binding protein, NifX family n=1 Tax=Desulfurobacterium pacificum TaxID=240166 RepID=A0ABY1NCQ4_9BACT|nr:NifB/NifX family molybdenum-iron cluster-binding protein [Desulfurobacterium pacificum]SMP06302.1 Predicted Fe-Mo cluster-binding protein, NifX family [Desulfurobacterium pacificum]